MQKGGQVLHIDFFEDTVSHSYGNNLSSVLSWPLFTWGEEGVLHRILRPEPRLPFAHTKTKKQQRIIGKAPPNLIFSLTLSEQREELKLFACVFTFPGSLENSLEVSSIMILSLF